MEKKLKIFLYQIAYDLKSMPDYGSGFLPYDVRANPEFLKREMAHMIRFYDDIVSKGNDGNLYGLFSSKFYEKTGGVTADEIKATILKSPNADIYLFNPFPAHVYRYLNVWCQGENNHPGLINLANQLFSRAGFDFDASQDFRNSVNDTVYCNYWVGKKAFFDRFIPFVRHLDQTINYMPKMMRNEYFSDANYKIKACYYPFIFERLISTYLISNDDIMIHSYNRRVSSAMSNNIEKAFIKIGGIQAFEKWESQQNSIDVIKSKTEILNNYVQPDLTITFWRPLARLLLSFRKKINILMMRHFINKQFKI